MAGEGLAVQDSFAAFTDIKPEIDAFVYGKASHQAVLVIDVCPQVQTRYVLKIWYFIRCKRSSVLSSRLRYCPTVFTK